MLERRSATDAMTSIHAKLAEIESRWNEVAARELLVLTSTHPEERFYAVAFWLLYADYTLVGVPQMAANVEADRSSEGDARWSPPDWRWPGLDSATDAMAPRYEELTSELEEASDEISDEALELHRQLLARVARELTRAVRAGEGLFRALSVTNDFVVAILDGRERAEEHDRLVRMSVEPEILAGFEGALMLENEGETSEVRSRTEAEQIALKIPVMKCPSRAARRIADKGNPRHTGRWTELGSGGTTGWILRALDLQPSRGSHRSDVGAQPARPDVEPGYAPGVSARLDTTHDAPRHS